jgi:hypothetical protein
MSLPELDNYTEWCKRNEHMRLPQVITCPMCNGERYVADRCTCGTMPDFEDDECCLCGKPIHWKKCPCCMGRGTILE